MASRIDHVPGVESGRQRAVHQRVVELFVRDGTERPLPAR
jgi:hypothetical protein